MKLVYAKDGDGQKIDAPVLGKSLKVATTDASVTLGYSTGTITVVDGSTTIEGSGTTWNAANGVYEDMGLVVAGHYEDALRIVSITDVDTLVVDREPPTHLVGAGLNYEICLLPKTRYLIVADENCFIRQGDSNVTAAEAPPSVYLAGAKDWEQLYTSLNKTYLAVKKIAGGNDPTVYLVPCFTN